MDGHSLTRRRLTQTGGRQHRLRLEAPEPCWPWASSRVVPAFSACRSAPVLAAGVPSAGSCNS